MIGEAIQIMQSIRSTGNPQIIVGCSGGKDSLCVLDLCVQVFGPENVFPFFLWVIEGLECEEQSIGMVERRYGLIVHRLCHPDMCGYLQQSWLTERHPEIEEIPGRRLRWIDIERIMRSRTGAKWIAYGHRITDSPSRRAMIKGIEGVSQKRQVCYPIWDWKPREVFGYLRAKRIPIPPMFGSRVDRTSGLAPHSVECLLFLKANYPRDYQRVLEVFPRAKDLIYRDEIRARHGVTKHSEAAIA